MKKRRFIELLQNLITSGPGYAWYWAFYWLYPARAMREKSAFTSCQRLRRLLLRRTGVQMGQNVHVGAGVLVLGTRREPPPLILGDRVAVAPRVTFVSSSYPENSVLRLCAEIKPMVTFGKTITVEPDAWIGAHAVIMPGVTIGRGAVVGAGAVVLRNVEPWTIVAGVPAKEIRGIIPVEDGPEGEREGNSHGEGSE